MKKQERHSAVYFFNAIGIRHYTSVYIERSAFVKKSDLDNIYARVNKTLKNAYEVIVSEIPIVYITSVTKRTVQQFNLSHKSPCRRSGSNDNILCGEIKR